MIPLRDNIPSRTVPVVTIAIIGLNALVFIWQLGLGRGFDNFLPYLAIIPVRYTVGEVARQFSFMEQAIPFFSSQFLHGGWLHFLSNMWFLWIFGDNVEDRLGHARYFLFYLACGVTAGGAHILTNPGSVLPTIGASGAVAGVMGAYFLFYPRARVLTLIPIFLFIEIIEIPAFFFLGLWALIQILWGTASLGAAGSGGVAWWAHVGGFAMGVFLGQMVKKRSRSKFRKKGF